jgi:hypothetical protein
MHPSLVHHRIGTTIGALMAAALLFIAISSLLHHHAADGTFTPTNVVNGTHR